MAAGPEGFAQRDCGIGNCPPDRRLSCNGRRTPAVAGQECGDRAPPHAVRAWLVRLAALIAFLLVWWLITALHLVDEKFLPTPAAVWRAAVRASTWHQVAPGVPCEVLGEQNYFLWEHLVASLQRIGAGVGAAIILGPIVGFLMARPRRSARSSSLTSTSCAHFRRWATSAC